MGITKNIPAVILGALIALVCTFVIQNTIVLHFYPLPTGTDMYDQDSAARAFKLMPAKGLYMMLANYCITSLIGGIIATLVSKRGSKNPALVVGAVLTSGAVWYYFLLHEPLWFFLLALLTYLPFTYFGYLLVRKK